MTSDNPRGLNVLVFSSGNPAATFLAAGLLHGRLDIFGAVLVQGVGDAEPTQEVRAALTASGLDLVAWRPQIVSGPLTVSVDVGLTICVPT